MGRKWEEDKVIEMMKIIGQALGKRGLEQGVRCRTKDDSWLHKHGRDLIQAHDNLRTYIVFGTSNLRHLLLILLLVPHGTTFIRASGLTSSLPSRFHS